MGGVGYRDGAPFGAQGVAPSQLWSTSRGPGWPSGSSRLTRIGLTIGYALAFWGLHRLAAWWGGHAFYSLWFPAAGLRLALLWRRGAGFTPLVVLAELVVQLASGVIDVRSADWLHQAIDVVRPPLAYGAAVALVQRLTRTGDSSANPATPLSSPPMPLGLAAVLAPAAAVLAALPWSLWHSPTGHGPARAGNIAEIFVSLTGFLVGDLLGVLLVAPPLLWLADVVSGSARSIALPRLAHVAEGATVLAAAMLLAAAFGKVGLGLPETPVLLATAWIGLRFGRAAAWAAILVTTLLVLPWTAAHPPSNPASADARIDLHLGLAGIVVAGYIAGSFSDAQIRARQALARRDRLLFQAERLKTLRAMSVAVIHEISQPLSTLAIEARHLHELSVSAADPEIGQVAALVDRKTTALAQLVRRLRRFGGRSVDEPSPLTAASLLDGAVALVRGEATAAGVRLWIASPGPDVIVIAQEIEITQALVNLVRNAVQASEPGAIVTVSAGWLGKEIVLGVSNPISRRNAAGNGMGVGALVSRAIVEAHGGRIEEETAGGARSHHIILPAGGPAV